MKLTKFVVVCIGVAGLLLGITACSAGRTLPYANAECYSAGDTSFSEPIEHLDIDWVSGKVNIVTHSDSSVLLSEETDFSKTDDMRVHWWLDGTTLRVRFSAPGVRFSMFHHEKKELTIRIPETMNLAEITVNAASADVTVDGPIKAETFSVSTASGEMDISCESNEIDLGSASGDIKLEQIGKTALVQVHTASGNIESSFERCEKADFDSASGKIDVVANELSGFSANSASGDISCEMKKAVSKCEIRTVSGEITLGMPDDLGFTVKIDSVSGNFRSDLALKKDGKTYVYKDGSTEVFLKTTSGDMMIR